MVATARQAFQPTTAQAGEKNQTRLIGALLLLAFLLLYGGVGKDLLYNPFRTLSLEDPYAAIFNIFRYVLIVASAVYAMMVPPQKGAAPMTAILAPMVPFLLINAASMAWTIDSSITNRYVLLFAGFLFGITVMITRLGEEVCLKVFIHFLIGIMFASFFVAIVFPKVGTHNMDDVAETTLAGSWRGIFTHKNTLGPYAAYAVAMLINTRKALNFSKLYYWSALFVSVACLALSKSSGSYLGTMVILGSAFVIRSRTLGEPAALILIAVVGALAVYFLQSSTLAALLGKDETLSGRTIIWEVVLGYWAQSPLLGFGYMTGGLLGENFLKSTLFASANDAHNGYIETLVNTGLIGLFILLATLLVVLVRSYNLQRRLTDPARTIVIAYMAQIIGGLVLAMSETSPFRIVSDGAPTFATLLILTSLYVRSMTMLSPVTRVVGAAAPKPVAQFTPLR